MLSGFLYVGGENKMWGLFVTTILTSAADSLNPFAITQQFVLQGMVKKPKHIWYFILPTGITNLVGGFLAYYGLVSFLANFFEMVMERHGRTVFIGELILGIIFLAAVFHIIQNTKIESLKKHIRASHPKENKNNDEAEAMSKVKSVSPTALVLLGIGATLSELATALPYFAFMAILLNYQLTLIQVTLILIVYNTIYTLPLILLYIIYIKAQDRFDHFYTVVKTQITKWFNVAAPVITGSIGSILIFHSLSILLK